MYEIFMLFRAVLKSFHVLFKARRHGHMAELGGRICSHCDLYLVDAGIESTDIYIHTSYKRGFQ